MTRGHPDPFPRNVLPASRLFRQPPRGRADARVTMTRPRAVVPGRFYMITRRCAQRQFLLHPDDDAIQTFAYCLGYSMQKFEMEVLGTCVMSNHYHAVIFDRHGRYPQFLEYLHRTIARAMNVLRERREAFWTGDQVNVVRLDDYAAVIDKLCYTFVNPVRHNTVADPNDWPGLSTYKMLRRDTVLKVRRPDFFFRKNRPDSLPAYVELKMTIPEELGARAHVLADLKEHLASAAEYWRAYHQARGRTPLGRRAVLRQSWWDFPAHDPNHEQWRTRRNRLKPTRASKDPLRREEAAIVDQTFLDDHRRARVALKAGRPCVFPYGTYWHARFCGVDVARRPRGATGPFVTL
ncbi:MAG TPA: hypothetical protein VFQ53_07415 [Kofleriaceae bacterium]|nr:hypothetical protein [Kofleriaceae bacterium]